MLGLKKVKVSVLAECFTEIWGFCRFYYGGPEMQTIKKGNTPGQKKMEQRRKI